MNATGTLPRQVAPLPAQPIEVLPSETQPVASTRRAMSTRAVRRLKTINILAVTLPMVGLALAIWLSWGIAFNWVYLGIMTGMYILTGLGITIGFHRLCTHKAFSSPAIVRYFWAAAGSMAVEGPVIRWCGDHRQHHQHSDTEMDPHSPHMHPDGSWGEGFWATVKGAYHAHCGWLFTGADTSIAKYTKDLHADPVIALANKQFLMWVLIGLAIPAVLGGLLTMTWMGAVLGFLWGGLVRILLVHHITWSVNSICHLWGARPFESHDESRNNLIVGILGMGEGWHNNHHAFPTSARHGLFWWQFDLSYLIIRAMKLVGLAKDVRVPDKARLAEKRRDKKAVATSN